MRVRFGVAALLPLVLAGCPGQGAASGRSSASDEPGRAPGPAAPAGEASAAAAVGASPLPEELVLAAEPGHDGVALVIQNRSQRVVELALEASVERVGGASGEAAAGSEGLRLDCAQTAAHCLSLVPGAELRTAAWPAREARAQCGAGTRAAAAAGRYRFAVRPCTAAASTRSSEPFELP